MKYLEQLPTNRPGRSPHISMMWRESRFAYEWLRSRWLGERALQGLPHGHGQRVMLLPGFDTDDKTLATLCHRLRQLGYDARTWGLGRNHGRIHKIMPELVKTVTQWQHETAKPVALIGWSLGGFIAREIARDHPDLVASVMTLGSPAVGGPKYTITASAYRKQGHDLDQIEADMAKRDAIPIQCPLTVVFTRKDGIVKWPATLDRVTPHARHVEVTSSHMGLVIDANVFRVIARALADQTAATE